MSHITRRRFIERTIGAAGLVALAPIIPILPEPVAKAPFMSDEAYKAFAEALCEPFLQEIREASVMRRVMTIKKVGSV